jgi:hypothetical protein
MGKKSKEGYSFLMESNCIFFNVQDETTFEKQSALFALAVSDIVLINMYMIVHCSELGTALNCFFLL